jgi:hypothetical protein
MGRGGLYFSAAPANNEQSDIVAWRARVAEAGNISQGAIGDGFRISVNVTPQRTDETFFVVLIAFRILCLRNAIGIQDETVAFAESNVAYGVPRAAKKAERQSGGIEPLC